MTSGLQQDRAVTALVRDTLASGGATVPLNGGTVPADGYMVGGVAPPLLLDSRTVTGGRLRAAVDERLTDQWSVASDIPSMYLGSWTDADTGRLYVEISEHIATLADAEEIGRQRGELAVWDLGGSREIRLTSVR